MVTALLLGEGALALQRIPPKTAPCEHPEYWTLDVRSSTRPILVHYRSPADEPVARQVLAFAEEGWAFHVGRLGFREPLGDGGKCGPDGAFDVFLWRGHEECFVDECADDASTAWDDHAAFMVVDPWGQYGGQALRETVVHEMAHACQAVDDWNESPILFEMSAVFTDEVFADSYVETYLEDFQAHSDWSIDRDDKYRTWYMYGAALYLHYLRDRWFGGDVAFLQELWHRLRSPAGVGDTYNEPDFEDAIDALLAEKGASFVESVADFGRWRWFTGKRDDGRHFRHFTHGQERLRRAPVLARRAVARPGQTVAVVPAPMMLGTTYLDLRRAGRGEVCVSLHGAKGARFVVQAVPGLDGVTDGETLDLASGPSPLRFASNGRRTVLITATPLGKDDPETRTSRRYAARLKFSACR